MDRTQFGLRDLAALLIDRGADVDKARKDGSTALFAAAKVCWICMKD